MKKLKEILLSMRPKQWLKNVFVLPALIFSKEFLVTGQVLRALIAFALFCLASGSVYIFNDLLDKKKDLLHPIKKNRPIASGRLTGPEALLASLLICFLSLSGAWFLQPAFFLVLVAYVLTVVSYSLWLKHQPILDVMAIAAGFVLRTYGGAVAISVVASPWLLLCTTLLCLFLAVNKRKGELEGLQENAGAHRKALDEYTPEFLEQMLTVIMSSAVMSYSLYVFFSGKTVMMMLTIPFVIYGLFRYQLVASQDKTGENPEYIATTDLPLIIDGILWAASCLIIVALFY
jgi:4-hydroxybenzoate polyprenyltransferase